MATNKLLRYFCDSKYRFCVNTALFKKHCSLNDKEYLEKMYKGLLGKKLDLSSPKLFNEKLQWLKLYDRRDIYTDMVDKYKVREFIKNAVGESYLIPLLGVWDSPDQIDFDSLPDRFVIKCNHNSGLGMYICTDKSTADFSKIRRDLAAGLAEDYYSKFREFPYKNVSKKIIAEQYMEDTSGGLIDYKVHNFNGEPKVVLVCKDRFSANGLTEDFYTADWEHMPLKRPDIPNSKDPMPRPRQLNEILELSKKLSEGIPFVRTDFYIINNRVYFSEITFFPGSGFAPFEPDEWDKTFGDWIDLRCLKTSQ